MTKHWVNTCFLPKYLSAHPLERVHIRAISYEKAFLWRGGGKAKVC